MFLERSDLEMAFCLSVPPGGPYKTDSGVPSLTIGLTLTMSRPARSAGVGSRSATIPPSFVGTVPKSVPSSCSTAVAFISKP